MVVAGLGITLVLALVRNDGPLAVAEYRDGASVATYTGTDGGSLNRLQNQLLVTLTIGCR